MKPNENQLKVIAFFKECLIDWENTNDISSPSHHTLIDENRDKYLIDFKLNDLHLIDNCIDEMLKIIRNLK